METENSTNISVWIKTGVSKGAETGVKLALTYLMIPAVLKVVLEVVGSLALGISLLASTTFDRGTLLTEISAGALQIVGAFGFALIFVTYGMIIGGIPALILGAVTGALMGNVYGRFSLRRFQQHPNVVGLSIGVAIASLIHLPFVSIFFRIELEGLGFYLFFLGVPTLVYLSACVCLAHRLPRFVEAEHPTDNLLA